MAQRNKEEMIPVIHGDGGNKEIMFYAKNKKSAAQTWRRRMKDSALERCGFQIVVFESDPEIHGSHYFRCSYAK